MSRVLTAVVAVPLLLLVILGAAPSWFLFLTLVSGLIAYWELSSLMTGLGAALPPTGYLSTALVIGSYYSDRISFAEASLIAVLIVLIGTVLRHAPGKPSALAAIGAIFAIFYVGALLGSLVALRLIPPEPDGRHWVVFVLAVVMVGDAAAFYVGKSIGKTPLAPRLSPKKTVEGLIGNIVGSAGAAALLQQLGWTTVSPTTALVLGGVLALLGVTGDLFESFLKRSAGVKDASALIPGHGGLLDRLDSILFAAPGLLLGLRWLG